LAQKRQQQAARAGAEIEDAQLGAAIGDRRERSLDQGLAVGARIQRFRRELEIEAPEFAPASEARERLVPGAAADQRLELRPRRRIEGALGPSEKLARIDAERRGSAMPLAARRAAAAVIAPPTVAAAIFGSRVIRLRRGAPPGLRPRALR